VPIDEVLKAKLISRPGPQHALKWGVPARLLQDPNWNGEWFPFVKKYRLEDGDSLSNVALVFGLKPDVVVAANAGSGFVARSGDYVIVPASNGSAERKRLGAELVEAIMKDPTLKMTRIEKGMILVRREDRNGEPVLNIFEGSGAWYFTQVLGLTKDGKTVPGTILGEAAKPYGVKVLACEGACPKPYFVGMISP
jgi:hypothetical protein